MDEITAQSQPDYDAWGPDSYWTCSQWTQYHRALKETYGKSQADIMFEQAWDMQGVFEHDYWSCKYDQSFYNYIKEEFPQESGLMAGVWHAINQAGNVVADTADAASSTTSVLKTVIPIVIIVAVLLLIFYAYNQVNKASA